MTKTETAWLAGLLEGEACFNVDHRSHRTKGARPGLRITVEMTDEDVIRRVGNLFGSDYSEGAPKVARDGFTRKPTFRTYAWGRKAERMMQAVLPYMGERRTAKIKECLSTPNLSHTPRKATA